MACSAHTHTGQRGATKNDIVDMATAIPPSPPPAGAVGNRSHRRSIQLRHVRRKSGSRVHMAKMTPLIRVSAAHTDTEADLDAAEETSTTTLIRRSQSQSAILSRSRTLEDARSTATQALTSNSSAANASHPSPHMQHAEADNATPAASMAPRRPPLVHTSQSVTRPVNANSPTSFVSQRSKTMAAPVAQTFNTIANELVPPSRDAYDTMHLAASNSSSPARPILQRSPMRSTFSCARSGDTPEACALPSSQTARPGSRDRVDQERETRSNRKPWRSSMPTLSRELVQVQREYLFVKEYRDPMVESLARCLSLDDKRKKGPSHGHRPMSPVDNTMVDLSGIHSEQCQAIRARKRQERLLAMGNRNQPPSRRPTPPHSPPSMSLLGFRWSSGSLWGKTLAGNNVS